MGGYRRDQGVPEITVGRDNARIVSTFMRIVSTCARIVSTVRGKILLIRPRCRRQPRAAAFLQEGIRRAGQDMAGPGIGGFDEWDILGSPCIGFGWRKFNRSATLETIFTNIINPDSVEVKRSRSAELRAAAYKIAACAYPGNALLACTCGA